MPAYHYRVARIDGTTIEGWREGVDAQEVREQLERQGFLVFQLRRRGAWPNLLGTRLWIQRTVPFQELLVFNQEFVALVKAGLPILKAWDLLLERTRHPAFLTVLRAVRQDIRSGAALSDAIARHPNIFPTLYVASLKAGEQSGNLPEVLQRYIAYLKLIIGLRQKMGKALAYPAFLIVVGMAVVAFLLAYVLPTFSAIYGATTTQLPPATKLFLALIESAQAHLFLIGVTGAAAVWAIRLWSNTPAGRATWDRSMLSVPLIGEVVLHHYTVQFSRTLATVLAAGTPVVQALPIVRGTVTNRFLADGLATAMERVREGATLAAALAETQLLPKLALEMIAVGEETGSLETMLRDVAELYEGDLDQRLNQLTTWVEPALLLIMGVIVGVIVIVMYLPVFQMADTLR